MPGMKRQGVGAALALLLWATSLSAAHPVGSGPEPAIVYADAALPAHTVYRPAQLASRYPVMPWGKGDGQAQASFVGNDCGLCSGSGWTLRRQFPE